MIHTALLYLFASHAFASSTAESSADIVISNDSLLGFEIRPPYITVKQVITEGENLGLATVCSYLKILAENKVAIGINNCVPMFPCCAFAENKDNIKMHACLNVV